MDILLLLPVLACFLLTIFILPLWIKRAREIGLVGKDINKYSKPEVAEGGGIAVIGGFTLGLLIYVAIKTFYFNLSENLIDIFVILVVILMLCFIGMIDSLLAAKTKSSSNPNIPGWRKGLRKRYRILLCIFAAVPLMVINAGQSTIGFPFLDGLVLGWIYPLILIPLGVVGAATTFNFLAGYNGLEAGQGVIIISALSLVAYLTGNSWLGLIGLCFVFSLLALLIFNKYPARVFPGDVLTYPIGGMIAIMAIVGNMEKIALFFFIPYIVEVFLKARGRLKKQSFGKPNKNGSLDMPYDKIYGLEHAAIWFLKKINGKATEKGVVYLIYFVQILIIIAGFLIFRNSIFKF